MQESRHSRVSSWGYIRNPLTAYLKEWYLDRIFWCCLRRRNYVAMFERNYRSLMTIGQRAIEDRLKSEAIIDLYNYIVNASKRRKFVIQLLEIGNENNKFGCLYKNGSWQLTRYSNFPVTESQELEVNDHHTSRRIRRMRLGLGQLYDLANGINVVGIAFLEPMCYH